MTTITTLGAAPGPLPATTRSADTSTSAKSFEAMTLDEFLQPMFATIDGSNDMFGGGEAEATLKPMLITEFAKLMEQRGGLGLSGAIQTEMDTLGRSGSGNRP